MYIINTSDGTSIEIESGVYTITNGETNIITELSKKIIKNFLPPIDVYAKWWYTIGTVKERRKRK